MQSKYFEIRLTQLKVEQYNLAQLIKKHSNNDKAVKQFEQDMLTIKKQITEIEKKISSKV